MLSFVGLIGGLALLIALTVRGTNLFIATPVCALLVALTSGIALLPPLAAAGSPDLVGAYMGGFSGFVSNWFFMFLLGSLFGKLMEDSGAADAIAQAVTERLGARHAAFTVVAICAVLTYGGVSLFVVAFSVYPMALALFRGADLPRRFIPAALAFGSVTFTMTSAGSPEIQNWIPIQYLHTSPLAGWRASLLVAIFMAIFGQWWFNWMLARARARGERFEAHPTDHQPEARERLPALGLACLPPLSVLLLAFTLHEQFKTAALIISLLMGCLVALLVGWRYFRALNKAVSDGSTGALIAIGNTAAVIGFGAVAKLAPAFALIVEWVTHLPGGGLVGAAVAVSLIAGMTGSASGGQAIALPIIAPIFLGQGVDPSQLHRVVALASGALDALPHNGYVVTTIGAICNESHRRAYPALAALALVVPTIGMILCIALFALGV